MVCITLLCVQTIPILSTFFLCHPYIPLSNLKNFSFTCYTESYTSANAGDKIMYLLIVYTHLLIREIRMVILLMFSL